jgi:hypothetical protein
MSIDFILTDDQLILAENEAIRRQTSNEMRGIKGRNRAPAKGDTALQLHRLGCIGEVVIASFLGLEKYLFEAQEAIAGSDDLPGRLEVKTRSKYNYDLLIQLNDDPTKLYVLVAYERDKNKNLAKIIGWVRGGDVMKSTFVREFVRGRPCYAIPHSLLKSPETIKAEIDGGIKGQRVLGHDEAWIAKQDEDIMLNLSETLLNELGWKPGDTLTWYVDEQSNSCYLKK